VSCVVWLNAKTLVVTQGVEGDGTLQLWRMSYPDGKLTRITNDVDVYQGLSLTPDGSALVTVKNEHSPIALWVGEAMGIQGMRYESPEVQLGERWPGGVGAGLAWSGETLFFSSLTDSRTVIQSFIPGKSRPYQVVSGSGPTPTYDGKRLVYQVGPDFSDHGIWIADLDGGHKTRLAEYGSSPTVTPDGQVFFMNGDFKIMSVSIDGGNAKEVIAGPANEPRVSGDGKLLLYGENTAEHPLSYMLCDLPGCTSKRPLHIDPLGNELTWMPEGHVLAYPYQGNIWAHPLDGSPPTRITNIQAGGVNLFAFSRDGSRLAMRRSGGTGSDVVLFTGLNN
jgi:Tol biopolymer transport system component